MPPQQEELQEEWGEPTATGEAAQCHKHKHKQEEVAAISAAGVVLVTR
jgi:hypothetical protein